MVNRKMLDQLEEQLISHMHVDRKMNFDEWEEVGNPHMWSVECYVDDVSLLVDTGYGLMALFVDDVLHAVGHTIVMSKNKEYVGLHIQDDIYGIYKNIM